MLLDLTDYDSKKLELEIKRIEKDILEKEKGIVESEIKKLELELKLIGKGITKEDFDEQLIDFVESGRNDMKYIEDTYLELMELIKLNHEVEEDLLIEDSKAWEYIIISVNVVNMKIEDLQEEIRFLNVQKLNLMDKLLEMQERKVDEIATERKLKELLHDD